VRGSRIKAVIDELRGERIDIIKWSDSLETLVMNGLKPAVINIDAIYPDLDRHSVTVLVDEDQQSLAIGKRGQNVRLASRLCGWEIEIKTNEEYFGGAARQRDAAAAEGNAPGHESGQESGASAAPEAEQRETANAEVYDGGANDAPDET
jgi:transcription antitermination factor NusA-like protein